VGELGVRGHWRVPVEELSALALRLGATGSAELLAVGDRAFSIAAGDAKPPGTSEATGDLAEAVGEWSLEPDASQWEGLAADGAGRAFVLQEHPGDKGKPSHVFVFAPDLKELDRVIALVVEGDDSAWKRDWLEHKNTRGEALALLRDGHLLVAKQKEPARLIEFGPKGAHAAGLGESRFLAEGEPFDCPRDYVVEYEPLHSWGVAEEDTDELPSINDLTVHEGRLYAISRDSRVIARLEATVGPEESSVGVADSWLVPAVVRQPEGLVMLDGLVPIVGDDVSADEDTGDANTFLLNRLP
jgi:hypothetical protein